MSIISTKRARRRSSWSGAGFFGFISRLEIAGRVGAMTRKFILQGITEDSHLDEIRDAISVANVSRVVISVAFLTERGFGLLSDILEPIADKTVILAGIRNGITSAQGLLACVECGCKTYAVDTGSRGVVFHPKIYLGKSDQEARLVLGSANLTVGGLNSRLSLQIVCMGLRLRWRGRCVVRHSPVQDAGTIAGSCRDIWLRRLGSAAGNSSTGCVDC